MDKELQALLDKDNIIETITMLFIGAGEPKSLTPQQIVEGWDKGLKPLKAIHHQAGNFMVTVKELKADVYCYGTASHYFPNPSGKNTRTYVGSYDFHLIKEGKFWRIYLIRFNLKFIDGNQDLEAS
jgi:hypothetical protein